MKLLESGTYIVGDQEERAPRLVPFIGGILDKISIRVTESPQDKNITIITVSGDMDTNTAPEFEKSFQSVLQNKKFKIVVDLRDVHYISSAGWGIFVSEIKQIRNEKGDLVLAGMNPDVMDIFELLQFESILKYFPNVDSAVEKGFKVSLPLKK